MQVPAMNVRPPDGNYRSHAVRETTTVCETTRETTRRETYTVVRYIEHVNVNFESKRYFMLYDNPERCFNIIIVRVC